MLRVALQDFALLRARRSQLLLAGALIVLGIVMLRSAWLSDDGLITFRTIDHFVNGDGLRWNLAERVQAYTHPLWLFLLAPFYALTREAFYTPILVSLIVSAAAVLCAVAGPARAGRTPTAIAAVLCLASSKAFVDYSTSGLETPLSYLLLALWLHLFLGEGGARRLFGVTLLTSLMFVNRMDSVLLVAPGLLWSWMDALRRGVAVRHWLSGLALGSGPALLWVAFAIFYYGTPFPNTFYAKLGTGIDPALLREQGALYIAHGFRFDPTTGAVIVIAIALAAFDAIRNRRVESIAVGLGILLQLGYVVEIGGDFMVGRFLALPFFVGVVLLSRLAWSQRAFLVLGLCCVALSLANPLSPLRSGPDYENRDEEQVVADRGISDERGFYYSRFGLLAPGREESLLVGARCGEEGEAVVIRSVCGLLGYEGFTACRATFIADRCALSDAMLARMPMIDPEHWRVGHYFRRVPQGYRESLEKDANRLTEPEPHALYEDIRKVTREPLLAPGRFAAIWRLNRRSHGWGL